MKRPLPPLRMKALEKAPPPIDDAALARVSAEERLARQRADSKKRKADRPPGELDRLSINLSKAILDAIKREAFERGASISHVVEEALAAHLSKSASVDQSDRAAPVPSYLRIKPR